MTSNQEIRTYYDELAERYDDNRFGNTYGRYLHEQEKQILRRWLKDIPVKDCVELGCGTGRLLDFAGTGVDFSPKMLKQAAVKYPKHQLQVADITDLPFSNHSFKAAFAVHVLMHLDIEVIRQVLRQAYRIIRPGGYFIFDVPNLWRRRFINYSKGGWHGNTALSQNELGIICGNDWRIVHTAGVLLFPIHQLPNAVRRPLRPLDSWLCRTPLKRFASYHFYALQRQ